MATTEMNYVEGGGTQVSGFYPDGWNKSGIAYASSSGKVTVGFEPSKLMVTLVVNSTLIQCCYDKDISTSGKYYRQVSGQAGAEVNFVDSTSVTGLASIDADGFTISPTTLVSNISSIFWVAVK